MINNFVNENKINTVMELGHGDGNQLKLASYPNYIGFDVSETAVEKCRKLFDKDNNKTFKLLREYNNEKADLALSLDVIYHLIEDNVYEYYMEKLFNSSNKYVIIIQVIWKKREMQYMLNIENSAHGWRKINQSVN
ncbi:MAG: class I SAM-dependent methyltransferase [Methanobrevibacter sp.]|nr:class I SAM-dependent methyltransferase [Candidatus Methanoflexus mossambicus]